MSPGHLANPAPSDSGGPGRSLSSPVHPSPSPCYSQTPFGSHRSTQSLCSVSPLTLQVSSVPISVLWGSPKQLPFQAVGCLPGFVPWVPAQFPSPMGEARRFNVSACPARMGLLLSQNMQPPLGAFCVLNRASRVEESL